MWLTCKDIDTLQYISLQTEGHVEFKILEVRVFYFALNLHWSNRSSEAPVYAGKNQPALLIFKVAPCLSVDWGLEEVA